MTEPFSRQARRTAAAAVFAALFIFAGLRAARAIIINDGAVSLVPGGVVNYYDSGNVYSNVVELSFAPPAGSNNGSICTGTLINARTILTAAHCVSTNSNANTIQPTSSVYFSPLGSNGPANSSVLISGAVRAAYNGSIFPARQRR